MFTTTRRVKLRETPSTSAANPLGVVRGGDQFEKVSDEKDGWVKVRVLDANNGSREGWIQIKYIKASSAQKLPNINLEKFALAALYNARDFNTNAYYLIALAHVLSNIENRIDEETGARGPYLFKKERWQALLSLNSDELADVRPGDIDDPAMQTLVAALIARDATEQLQSVLQDRRLPTASELLLCHFLGLPMAKALLASDLSEPVDEALSRHFGSHASTDEQVKKTLEQHSALFLIAAGKPRSIEQILEFVGVPLDAGLKRAAEIIEQLPEDERASSVPTEPYDANAPWMKYAKAEIGQTEDMRKGYTNDRIQQYHAVSYPASPRLDDIAWCAAFVSWCLAQCEEDEVRSSNIKSALASDWMKWGQSIEQPVYGALVVLEPLVDGSSGHVGFCVGIEDDHILLLGGNQRDLQQVGQPDAVCIRKFRLSKVRGFRWLPGLPVRSRPEGQPDSSASALSVSPDDLKAIANSNALNTTSRDFLTAFNKYAPQYGVTSQRSIAFALANFCVETGGFLLLEENLNYTAKRLREVWPSRFKTLAEAKQYEKNPKKLANHVYGNRLGNTGKPDAGWRYRGSGPGQVTGYDNFLTVEQATGLGVIADPDILRQADSGTKAALLLWQKWNMNAYVEGANLFLTKGRKRWNGGTHGLVEMKAAFKRAMKRKLTN